MADKEETRFLGQIRRLSRRLSGNILSTESTKEIKPNLLRNDKKQSIYSYDEENQMRIGGLLLRDLAEEFGTPLYIYDVDQIKKNYNYFNGLLKNKNFQICFSVATNSNLAILNIFSRLGANFNVLSGGELTRCLAAGIDPSKIIFSGCGKTLVEIELAVKSGVFCINVESWEELDRIESASFEYGKIQNISITINTDFDDQSQSHKFGVPISEALEIYNRAKASSILMIKGITFQVDLSSFETILDARDKLLHLADELRQESKICIEQIHFNGELFNQNEVDKQEISKLVEQFSASILERGLKLIFEPGKNLISDAGVLLTKIEYVATVKKEIQEQTSPRRNSLISGGQVSNKKNFSNKNFLIVDAGFNDLGFTALFKQNHSILPVSSSQQTALPGFLSELKYDIVGPSSNPMEIIQKNFALNQKLLPGEYLIIFNAGAYGSSLSNNFLSRNRTAEVIITEKNPLLIREREKYEDQYVKEKIFSEMKLNSLQEEIESQEE